MSSYISLSDTALPVPLLETVRYIGRALCPTASRTLIRPFPSSGSACAFRAIRPIPEAS